MKKSIVFILFITTVAGICQGLTRLDRSGSHPVLKSDGRGIVLLGGELGNSAATCADDIDVNMQKLASMGLNTVLVPAYWDLTEPEEGKFDFTLTDRVIDSARENGLGVVFLWFGAWKNSMSCYTPEWFKRDTKRFPRAYTAAGKPLEIASAFSDNVLQSDLKAFSAWLRHVKDYDTSGTVRMIQIENEIGMLEDARDHSSLANAEYRNGVPAELMKHLKANQYRLHPELKKKWSDKGYKMSGSWTDVFGDDIFTDEYFMAWNYARYVERLASEGRKITEIPFYLNAAMNSRGRLPGGYPSAGPLAHLKDIWHAGAPTIDFLSPDIYDSGFEDWVDRYALADNPLFIPEVRRDSSNPAQAYFVIGHHNALGFSPFAIENGDSHYSDLLRPAYEVLSQLSSIVTDENKYGLKDGVLLTQENPTRVFTDGKTRITLSHYFTLPWDPRANDGNPWRDSGAILLRIAADEYLLAGTGVVAKFEDVSEITDTSKRGEDGFLEQGSTQNMNTKPAKTNRVGLATVEEVKISPEGTIERVRTFNGDETHQGRHARISVDDNKILRIKTYHYQ